MSHVVDEVVLNLCIALLTEYHHDGKDERNQQHNGENDAGNHEAHTGEDVRVHLWEVNAHHTHLRPWVVLEKILLIGKLLTFVRIVRTTEHLTTIGGRNSEMIRDVDTVVNQFGTDVLIEHTEVNTFLQRLIASSIKDVIDHLVEQCFLIDIAIANNLLHGLGSVSQRILILTQNHRLGNRRWFHLKGLQLERGIDSTIVCSHCKLMGMLNGAIKTIDHHRVLRKGSALSLIDVFFKISERLVHLHVMRDLIERAVHTLIELLFLHLNHLLDIGELKEEQGQERESHNRGYCPNSRLLHIGSKGNAFIDMKKSFS